MKRGMLLTVIAVIALGICWGVAVANAGSHSTHRTKVQTKTVVVAQADRLRPGMKLTVPTTYHHHRVTRYQWLRCNKLGNACKNIAGATHRAYIVRYADEGHTLRARVTWQGNTSATTNPTPQVGRPLPVNTAIPTISDDCASGNSGCVNNPTSTGAVVTVGDDLTGTSGTWKHAVRFTYQWEDCDVNGANCAAITGATNTTYTLQDSDVGDTIVFVVTAYNF